MLDTLLKRSPLFKTESPNKSTGLLLGESSGLLNWNNIKYPIMYEIYQILLKNFWKANEINMQDDIKQWDSLSLAEQEAYLKNITQLACLDSMQTPTMVEIIQYVTDPSVKANLAVVAQQEAVHTESYAYCKASLLPQSEQDKWYDTVKVHPLVIKRNKMVVDAYEEFRENPTILNFFKLLVHSIVLEGVFFYAGFAFHYHLASQQKMMKTATMISYIQRDEMQHSYFTTKVFQLILEEIPELNTEENINYVYQTLDKAVQLEKEWSNYLLKDIEGIDIDEYHLYVEYLANKRFRQMGLENFYDEIDNPMPWIQVYSDEMMNETKTDQFENKPRTYTNVSEENGFSEL